MKNRLSIFDNVCLMLGRVIFFAGAFVSAYHIFYMILTASKPIVDSVSVWAGDNKHLILIALFVLANAVIGISWLATDNNGRDLLKTLRSKFN